MKVYYLDDYDTFQTGRNRQQLEQRMIIIENLVKKYGRLTAIDNLNLTIPSGQFFGFLVVRTKNKKIKILNQFDGFHDFILNLKSKNPLIELRGC